MSEIIPDGQFFGALGAVRRVSGLTLAETAYRPGLLVPSHAHDHALFCLVLDGAFEERSGTRRRLCRPGTLLFHPGDEPHSHRFDDAGARLFNVQLGGHWLERVREHGAARLGEPVNVHGRRANWLAGHLYREFLSNDTAAELAIEGLTLAMLAEVARAAPGPAPRGAPPRWLPQAVELLHARFRERLGLEEVAREVGIHPVQLARAFRRYHRCTMGEYLRALRVDYARRELLASDEPLAAIAYAAGFADQGHFSRTFKAMTGMTPGEYRRRG